MMTLKEFEMKIYWKRLKKITEEITNKKVEIIMNIENSNLRGAIQSNHKIIIYLNMSYNKSRNPLKAGQVIPTF